MIASLPDPLPDDGCSDDVPDRSEDTQPDVESDGPVTGGTLGDFELLALVGRGGMGNVFYAWDTKLDRPVAIKLPRLDTVGVPGLRNRFLREARMAAKLNHPLLVSTLQVGHEGSHFFMASQWCPGGDLGRWLKQHSGPYSPASIALLIIQLCEAISHCHHAGVLHLDLKPSNILLAEAPAENATLDQLSIRVADFGVARMLDHKNSETLSTLALGTPHYMAPEQAFETAGPPGPAADIYSIGVILHELMYGFRPVEGNDPIEILSKVRTLDYVDCPAKRGLPKDLRTICSKCLARSPRERYQTADQLKADLESFIANRSILAKPHSWPDRFLAWCRRKERIQQAGQFAIALQLGNLFMLPLPLALGAAGYPLPEELDLSQWSWEMMPILVLFVIPLLVNGLRTLRHRPLAVPLGVVWSALPAAIITSVAFGVPSLFSVYHANPLASLLVHLSLATFGWVQVVLYLLALPAASAHKRNEPPPSRKTPSTTRGH